MKYNVGYTAGAMSNYDGIAKVTGSTIAHNYGSAAGGISNGLPPIDQELEAPSPGGVLEISKSGLLGNVGHGVGGVLNYLGSVSVSESALLGNGYYEDNLSMVGGILNLNSPLGNGGQPTPTSGAQARAAGDPGEVTITKSTIAGNYGGVAGGLANGTFSIYFDDAPPSGPVLGGNVTIADSAMYGNFGHEVGGALNHLGSLAISGGYVAGNGTADVYGESVRSHVGGILNVN